MAFRAKRVRIQIPCGGSGSVVDLAAGCDAGCSDSPQSAVCPPPAFKDAACGSPSNFFGINPWDEVTNPAEQFLLSPEDLPLFKQQLELKMKMLEIANDASALAKTRIETKLADVARAEKQLEEG